MAYSINLFSKEFFYVYPFKFCDIFLEKVVWECCTSLVDLNSLLNSYAFYLIGFFNGKVLVKLFGSSKLFKLLLTLNDLHAKTAFYFW